MYRRPLRHSFALAMLIALIVPLLAACGGQTAAPDSSTSTGDTAANSGATATSGEGNSTAATAPAAEEQTTEAAGGATTTTTGGSTVGSIPGVFRFNLGTEPSTADPQTMSFSDEITFGLMNYQPLMSFNLDLEPIPGQAESVEVSDDGKVYTFKLRPDSKYSDGSPLTAENFEFAWKRLADPELAGEYQFIGCGLIEGFSEYAVTTCPDAEGNTKTVTEALELDLETLREGVGVNAIDEQTLEIRLTTATPYFPSIAAMWVGAPVKQENVEVGPDWWYEPENYIGNGPFKLVEWDHENRAVWERNPNWVLGPAKLERVEMAMITEGQVAFEAYKNNELDAVGIAREDLEAIEADPQLQNQIVSLKPRYSFYLGFNLRRAPFDNPKVRQAFAYAFDRVAYANDIEGGLALPSYTFIPPGIPGHLEGEEPYKLDPDKAKQLLTEAGYPNGQGLPEIKLTYNQSSRNQTRFEWMANQIKQNLGIDVALDPVDANAYSELTKDPATTPQMFFLGWGPDYPDPQNYWSSVFKTGTSQAAEIGYSNPQFDQLTEQADREADPQKRLDLYKQASDLFIEDSPVVFMYYTQAKVLVKPWVQGISGETITPLDFMLASYNLQNITSGQ